MTATKADEKAAWPKRVWVIDATIPPPPGGRHFLEQVWAKFSPWTDLGGTVAIEYLSLSESEAITAKAVAEARAEALEILKSSEGDIDFAIFRIQERMRPEFIASEKRLTKTIEDCKARAAEVKK